jgi:ubiquinone/menaquinone biosynthesis C-methylase UbiE
VPLLVVALMLVAAALLWRRRHPKPFPARFAALLDSPVRRLVTDVDAWAHRLDLGPGMQVLEIGPGSGLFTEGVARAAAGVRITCLDIQPAMLRKVRSRLSDYAPALACGSASALPFRDGSFDRIVMVTVLGEVPDRRGALSECARVLRPDGMLAITESLVDPDFIAPRTLVREASHAGLEPAGRAGPWASYTQRFVRAGAARRDRPGAA